VTSLAFLLLGRALSTLGLLGGATFTDNDIVPKAPWRMRARKTV